MTKLTTSLSIYSLLLDIEMKVEAIRTEMFKDEVLVNLIFRVCKPVKANPFDLQGQSRIGIVPDLRAIFAWNARKMGFTLKAIGVFLDKDHSSVIDMCRRYEEKMEYDSKFQELVRTIFP